MIMGLHSPNNLLNEPGCNINECPIGRDGMMTTSAYRAHRFVSSAFLIFWCIAFRTSLCGQDAYWTPADPPKSHYVIDARLDLSAKGTIEGTETIILKNTGPRPMGVLAVDWSIGPGSTISVAVSGSTLMPLNPESRPVLSSPLFYPLPEPLTPGKRLRLEVAFRKAVEFSAEDTELGNTHWYPRLWWDGLPLHDSFSVKIDLPEGFALAASGRLNAKTGRYENKGARTSASISGRG
jgi:hypothetical protein